MVNQYLKHLLLILLSISGYNYLKSQCWGVTPQSTEVNYENCWSNFLQAECPSNTKALRSSQINDRRKYKETHHTEDTRKLCRPSAGTLWHCPLDLWPLELKISTLVTPAIENVHINFGFSMPFRFQFRSQCRKDGQKNDGWARPVIVI